MAKSVKVVVPFKRDWQHTEDFFAENIKKHIEEAVPTAKVELDDTQKYSFEVIANDVLIFSKHKTGRRPSFTELIDSVRALANGEPVKNYADDD